MRYYTDRVPVNTQLTSLVSSLKKATDAERQLIEKALRLGRNGGGGGGGGGGGYEDDGISENGDMAGTRVFNDWFRNASNTGKLRVDYIIYSLH